MSHLTILLLNYVLLFSSCHNQLTCTCVSFPPWCISLCLSPIFCLCTLLKQWWHINCTMMCIFSLSRALLSSVLVFFLFFCESPYRYEPVQNSAESLGSPQPFIIIWVSCTHLSPVSHLNNLPIPISFSLLATHTLALYLKGTGGVKTQSFIKTIMMASCQQWPQPSKPFGLKQCSLSHLEASPWRSHGRFRDQRAQSKWSYCKNYVQPSVLQLTMAGLLRY